MKFIHKKASYIRHNIDSLFEVVVAGYFGVCFPLQMIFGIQMIQGL